jgi:hypothetical protein
MNYSALGSLKFSGYRGDRESEKLDYSQYFGINTPVNRLFITENNSLTAGIIGGYGKLSNL